MKRRRCGIKAGPSGPPTFSPGDGLVEVIEVSQAGASALGVDGRDEVGDALADGEAPSWTTPNPTRRHPLTGAPAGISLRSPTARYAKRRRPSRHHLVHSSTGANPKRGQFSTRGGCIFNRRMRVRIRPALTAGRGQSDREPWRAEREDAVAVATGGSVRKESSTHPHTRYVSSGAVSLSPVMPRVPGIVDE
jgi:hypothetical protein